MTAIIDIRHISYTYPNAGENAVPALNDLSLRIAKGEYVAIAGANGSGKSTLARHLNALLIPQAGYVRVAGRNTRDPAHHPEIRRTVGMVFQRPEDQIVGTVVAHDVAFGLENLALPSGEIQERVASALRAVSLWDQRDRPPHMLSAGQMQRLALAGILAMRPSCIVFDEATAMLDPAGRRATRAMMHDLHEQGMTVLTITHRMEETLDADRLVILDRGRVVRDASPQRIFEDIEELQALGLDLPPTIRLAHHLEETLPRFTTDAYTVADLVEAIDALPHCAEAPHSDAAAASLSGDAVISVTELSHVYMRGTPFARRALHNVDLTVSSDRSADDGARGGPGGAHGLIGATGAGKSTLLQHLNGLFRPQQGQVRVLSHNLADPDTDLRTVRRRVGLVFQRPEAQIFEQYVGDEIAYGPRLAGLQGAPLRERVRWAMGLVGLDFTSYKDRLTFALSGGEQRKVALASTLALQPRVLLLDEPTAGLDPGARLELLDKLQGLRSDGMTLVLSSHEMEDIAALAAQVTVLKDGTTALDGDIRAIFGEGAQLRCLGLEVPVVTQVNEGLRARGWTLPPGIVNQDSLCAAVARHLTSECEEAPAQ